MALLSSDLISRSLVDEANRQGVDPSTVLGLFKSENGYLDKDGKLQVNKTIDTTKVSSAGAMGIMQVIPSTFNALITKGFLPATTDYNSPQGQIQAGVAAVKELNSRGIIDPIHVAVGYNGSPQVLDAFKSGRPIPGETTGYINKFTQATGATMPDTSSTTSVRTSTSSRDIPAPVQEGLDKSVAGFQSLLSGLGPQLDILKTQLLGTQTDYNKAVTSGATATGDVAQGQADQLIGKNKSEAGILDAMHINRNGDNEAQIQSLRTIDAAQAARRPLLDDITQLKSTNPLDDPAGWVLNNFKAMGKTQAYNALVAQENAANEDLTSRQILAQRQEAIQPADVQDAIQRTAAAQAQVALSDAQAKVAQYGGVVNQAVARTLVEQLHMQGMDVQQHLALAKLYSDKIQSTLAETDRDKANKDEDGLIQQMRLTLGTLGVPEATVANFSKASYRALPPEVQKMLGEAAVTGGSRTLGEGITLANAIRGPAGLQKLMVEQPVLGKFMKDVTDAGQAEYTAMLHKAATTPEGVTPELKAAKTPMEQLRLGIDSWQKRMEAETAGGDYSRLSPNNPAKLDYKRTFNLPEMADNTTAQFIKAQVASNPTGALNVDDRMLVNNAAALVANDPSKLAKVTADLANFYKTGIGNKAGVVGINQLGWHTELTYPVRLNTGFFGNDRQTDLTNPTQIEAAVMRLVPANIIGNPATNPMGDMTNFGN